MNDDVEQSGVEIDSGLEWVRRSFVFSMIGIIVGVGGLPGAMLLAAGVLAVACGLIGLRRIPKSRPVWYAKWMAAGGILLGCFLALVGFDQLFTPNRAITKAKKVTSLSTATALESALSDFYIEFGSLPSVETQLTTDSSQGIALLTILLGLDDKSLNGLNSRGIKFLSIREGKNKKNGLIYAADGKSVEGLFDPWGNPYTVILDTDYKENLHFTIGTKVVDLKGRRAAAFSPGPDHKLGTSDDVITW